MNIEDIIIKLEEEIFNYKDCRDNDHHMWVYMGKQKGINIALNLLKEYINDKVSKGN